MVPESPADSLGFDAGVANFRAGRYEAAARAFLEAQRRRPGEPSSLTYLGEIALRQGRISRALELFSAASRKGGTPRALAYAGQLKRRLGRTEEGLRDLERAIALDASCIWMASLGYGAGADAAVLASEVQKLDSILESKPNWAFGYVARGLARAILAGRSLRQAEADLRRGVRLDARCSTVASAWHAEFLRWGGRHRRAVALLDRIVRETPRDADALLRRGESRLFFETAGVALADFDRAVESKPGSGSALAWRAEVRLWLGDAAGALEDCGRALEAPEPALWSRTWKGAALLLSGRLPAAMSEFASALELDPLDAEALTWRGEALRLAGRDEEALADLDRAIELRSLLGAHLNRALANLRLGRAAAAEGDSERASLLGPRLMRLAGRAARGSARRPAAVLERALALSRGNRTIRPTFAQGSGRSLRLRPA